MNKLLSLTTCLLLGLFFLPAHATNVAYTADNSTVFPNPERGYTVQADKVVTLSEPNVITISDSWFRGSESDNYEKDNIRLLLYLSYLNNFREQDLPATILNAFNQDMQRLRDNGWKCVLRFAYANTNNSDAELSWIQRHLQQLKPYLAQNADVIYVMEAGFIGKYGEWYYSDNFHADGSDHGSHITDGNRSAVIDALLANAPSDRFVLFRTAMTKKEYLEDTDYTNYLSSAEAFTGTDRARMGFHNDAFLADYGDAGTYFDGNNNDAQAVRDYVAAETQYVPNGGETNVTDVSTAEARYANAPTEMATYHWSFCGNNYAQEMTSRWRTNGQYETMNKYMGYRYNLVDGVYSDAATSGSTMNVNIRIANVGYAPIYNARDAYIVLKKADGTSRSIKLASDPRRWAPNTTTTINETLTIPEDLPGGTYHLYLHLPDKYASIAADPRYAVRIASKLPNTNDVWVAETGMNDLGAEIVITGPVAPTTVEPGTNNLRTAIGNASAGDILELKTGIYYEEGNFNFNKSLTIRAKEGAHPVIAQLYYFRIEGGAKVTFQGIEFDGSLYGNTGQYEHCFRSHDNSTGEEVITLENCEIHHFTNGYVLYTQKAGRQWNSIIIRNCYFHDNQRGIGIIHESSGTYNSCNEVIVENSTFANTTDNYAPIYVQDGNSTALTVDHCTFYNNTYHCINTGASVENIAISNCIFAQPTTSSRYSATCTHGTISNCLSYNTAGYSSGPTMSGNITGNPLLIDPVNGCFVPSYGSPVLGAGTSDSNIGDPRMFPYTRTGMTAGTWGTICLPYAVSSLPEDIDFYCIAGKTANSLILSPVTTSLMAGQPYFFNVTSALENNKLVLPLDEGTPVTAGSSSHLVGTYAETTLAEGNYIVFGGELRRVPNTAGLTVKCGAYRAYIDDINAIGDYSAGAPGLRELPFAPENATVLDNTEAVETAVKFFENGRLFIRRAGIIYDALGRKITH